VNWVDSLGNTGTVNVAPANAGNLLNVAEGVQFKLDAGTVIAGQSFNIDVFNPTLTAAQNANVQIDGVYMSKASNTINDVFEGVTLDLISADPNTTVDIGIANDKTAVKAKIQSFVDTYNSLMSDLSNFSAYDEANKTAAPLLGDGFLSEVKSALSTITTTAMNALPDGAVYDSLAVIGIKGSSKGLLTIDSTALDRALDNNYESVINLFTQSFSSADSKIGYQSSTTDTLAGQYALVVNYNASGQPTSATINGQNATVDGLLIKGAAGTSAEGLVLSFTNPGSGPGTVNTTIKFGKGIGATLDAQVAQLLDSETGTLHFATENLNKNIESLDNQIETWNTRLAAVEQRLRRQFSNLETALSQMKNQSNYLAGVLG
jgi:flagellar hook-associated protein 2